MSTPHEPVTATPGDGWDALRSLYRSLPARRRREGWTTVALMTVGALAEIVSIGAVLPFLIILTDPGRLNGLPVIGEWVNGLPAASLPAIGATVFIGLFLLSGALRLLLAWKSQAFAFGASYDISVAAFRKIIRQPYRFYIAGNSSDLLSRFDKIHAITYTVLVAGVQAAIASVIAALLIVFLILIDPVVAIISAIVLVGAYLAISVVVQARLGENSKIIAFAWQDRVRRVQEALGGIRDILIDRSQAAFEGDFERMSNGLRRALTANAYIGIAPRIVIEMLVMVLIGILAWYLARQPGGLLAAIPAIGALALGAQRLIPLMQTAYVGWSQFLGSGRSLAEVAQLIALPEPPPPAFAPSRPFQQSIVFDKVGFAYAPGRPVLESIDFTVGKGERIGIVGRTGSGKSSLMDLLLGLLEPVEGRILIDGRQMDGESRTAWQAQVAHVPQAIYLADDSIAANIAFGVAKDRVDMALVRSSAAAAGIDEFVAGLPEGYATSCGERGVRLSGGQRQRIGIARALYKQASVLVFDEATSALDSETEAAVMQSIAALSDDITIFLIAHRLSTLAGCDRIIRLEAGRIEAIVEG